MDIVILMHIIDEYIDNMQISEFVSACTIRMFIEQFLTSFSRDLRSFRAHGRRASSLDKKKSFL